MARMGLDNIEIKAMGGRSVILTFTKKKWRKWLKKTVSTGGSLKLSLEMDKWRTLKDLCG